MRITKCLFMLGAGWLVFCSPAIAQDKTFQQPRIDDVRLDWCWSWAVKDCGQRVADIFCQRRHYTSVKDFRAEKAGGHTRFIGSNESCNDPGCLGFSYITCTGSISANPAFREFANPAYGGFRLDRCREWGVNCGAPVATAFCQQNGYSSFKYFRTDAGPSGVPTKLIGTNQVCNQSFCRGFQIIVCQK
jgi:hypothetical protein